jgi:hypothetical protein
VDVLPLIRHIEKLLRAMGGKRHKPATPPHNRKITGVWKKMNSSASPVKLLPAPADKAPYKPWPESATEPSKVNETECWSEALSNTSNPPASSNKPEKNKDTIAETPKKSRGGDGMSSPRVTEESKKKKPQFIVGKKKPKYSGQLLQFFCFF